ncbi:MAG: TolA-binding protein, partial [Rhodothermales bacterium]
YEDVKTVRDYQIQELCHEHHSSVWQNRDALVKIATTFWFPRIAIPGEGSDRIIDSYANRHLEYAPIAEHVTRWLSSGKVSEHAAARLLEHMRLPRDQKHDPLAPFAKQIGKGYLKYVMNSRGHLNYSAFGPAALPRVAEQLATATDSVAVQTMVGDALYGARGKGANFDLVVNLATAYLTFEKRAGLIDPEFARRFLDSARDCEAPEGYAKLYPIFMKHAQGKSSALPLHYLELFIAYADKADDAFFKTLSEAYVAAVKSASSTDLHDRRVYWTWAEAAKKKQLTVDFYGLFEKGVPADQYRFIEQCVLEDFLTRIDEGAHGPSELRGLLESVAKSYSRESALWKRDIPRVVEALEKKEAYELAYSWVEYASGLHYKPEEIATTVNVLKGRLSSNVPGLIPVPKGHAQYNVYLAQEALSEGSTGRAWELLAPALQTYMKDWETFGIDVALFVADRLRNTKRFDEAKLFSQTILLKELSFDAASMGTVNLIKADIYRDTQNFQAARVSYMELVNNGRYRGTKPAREAKLRLIDLLLLTKDTGTAEMEAQRLVDANALIDQAEGFYYLAQVATMGEDYEVANDYLKEVFKRNADHNRAKLLKGELRFHIRAGLSSTEIDMGTSQRQEIAVPGRELVLKLQDANLAIARAGQAIPVVVTTSVGKDRERVRLMVDQEDPTLFKGIINTGLGVVKPGNVRLELRGDDVISYLIDPVFQKANALDYPPKQLVVKSSARLISSSGEILSPKEQEERELARKLEQLGGVSAKNRGRNARTIRPGSAIHVQVTDFDQDVSDEADSALVRLVTNTGDILEDWPLEETGPHTGIFRSAIPTGIPAPMARASDTKEGTDAYGPINRTRNAPWESLGDGKAPKWYEVDTMSSHALSGATITVPNLAAIKSVRLQGYLGDKEVNLGQWPTATTGKGGIRVAMRSGQRGHELRQMSSFLKQHTDKQAWLPNLAFDGKRDLQRSGDGWRTVSMEGVFWLEDGQSMDFKLIHTASRHNWQTGYLFIDDNLLVSGKMSPQLLERGFSTYLDSGPHSIKLLMQDHAAESAFQLAYKNAQGEYVELPADWFSPEKNPKLARLLTPLGVVTKTADGFAATIKSEQRLRSLRWVFDEFSSSSVAISEATVTTTDTKTVIPVDEDFTTGRTNQVLEVAPGDDIEVTYTDANRLENDPPKLLEQLNATYFNADVSLNYEHVREDENGNMHTRLFQAKRIRQGDQLLVAVEDWDEDQSDAQDRVKATVMTSSGERLELELMERAPHNDGQTAHSAFFQQILTMGSETGGTTIKVVPGDTVTLLYTDSENTDPGVPTDREYRVNFIEQQSADIRLLQSSTARIEDRSQKALNKIRLLRQRGDKRETISMLKTQITADRVDTLTTANLQVPLVFNLVYPAGARHEGSVVTLDAISSSEEEAAKAEGRDPVPTQVKMRLQQLAELVREKGYDIRINGGEPKQEELLQSGMFAGLLRFQLGAAGDEPDTSIRQENDSMGLVSSAALQNVDSDQDDRFIVPTLVVKGSDQVTLRLRDDNKTVLAETRFKLASDGRLGLFDPQMVSERSAIHLGQSFQLRLTDADQDKSDELDEVTITIDVKSGQKTTWTLKETLPHSGVFSAAIKPEFKSAAAAAPDSGTKALSVVFGDTLRFSYTDSKTVAGEALTATVDGEIHDGFDGELLGFSKKFQDSEIAVRTQFLIAEAMFEMAKDHRKLKKDDLASEEIARGKRVLEEALRDYPNTKLKAQGEYLLANLAQELEKYEEAIGRYASVISSFPKSEFASKSQFKKALCLEKLEQYDSSTEEYVRLTYLYPTDPLVADATVRLGNYYYQAKEYKTAARIFEQFQARHPEHELGIKAIFLAGQSQIKRQAYKESIRVLDVLIDAYPDETVIRPEAMYWKGDSAFKVG